MTNNVSINERGLVPLLPPGPELVPLRTRQFAWLFGTQHRRAEVHPPLSPGWTGYSSQRNVRALALDVRRGYVWLATWGGVLAWDIEHNQCCRYTSEHGLDGNATRCIAVDATGTVWAAGEEGGLCCLEFGKDRAWNRQPSAENWTVLCMAARASSLTSEAGIYLGLQDSNGGCSLAAIARPNDSLQHLLKDDLTSKEIHTLLGDGSELWIGNAWGLHHFPSGRLYLEGEQVWALAHAPGGGIWVGTSRGLFRLLAGSAVGDEQRPEDHGWPRDAIMSLAHEAETGRLWVITSREIGSVTGNVWRSLNNSLPGYLQQLLTTNLPPTTVDQTTVNADHFLHHTAVETSATSESPPRYLAQHTWAAGTAGVYEIIAGGQHQEAFDAWGEDALCNHVLCLWADERAVWMGGSRGLHRFDAYGWRSDLAPALRDVRAIAQRPGTRELWVASRRDGLHRIEDGVYVPGAYPREPAVALATGEDGTLWAATPDEIYCLRRKSLTWQTLAESARVQIGERYIQSLAYQVLPDSGAAPALCLWVGTSSGLLCYRADLGLWDPGDWELDRLHHLPIRILTCEPMTGRLWAGTSEGLYCQDGHTWQRRLERDVRALAWDSDKTLWLGTQVGLEQWPALKSGESFAVHPLKPYTSRDDGLAARAVTALVARTIAGMHEVWVGSHTGLSCYRYVP